MKNFIKNFAEKVDKFLFEDVEDEIDEEEEKTQEIEEDKTRKAIDVEEAFKDVVVKQKTVEQVVVEPIVEKKTEQASAFVTLNPNPVRKEPTITTVIKPKEEKYIPRGVISPIYGNSYAKNEFIYTSNNSNIKVKEDNDTSKIGTIFSPINGNESYEVIKEDEVKDNIASLTTSDFISTVDMNVVSDEQPYIPIENMVQEQPVVQPTIAIQTPPVENITEFIKSEQPVTTPGKNKSVDDTDEYENLTLF